MPQSPLRGPCAEAPWAPFTEAKPSHQVSEGSKKGPSPHTPLRPKMQSPWWQARCQAPGGGHSTLPGRQWMAPWPRPSTDNLLLLQGKPALGRAHSAKVNGRRWHRPDGLRSEGLSAENPSESALGPAHSEVGVGRGRRPGLSFVRRGEALGDEDQSLGSRAGSEGGDDQPRPSRGAPAARTRGRSGPPRGREPAAPRAHAQMCSMRPRPGPAHGRGQRQERVAREWDNGARDPRPCRLRGLRGDRAHRPGSGQCRRGWLKADPPAHSRGRQPCRIATLGAATHVPSAVAPWEK